MKSIFIGAIILVSSSLYAQLSLSQVGISVSDSMYFRPENEPGDLNLGFSFNRKLSADFKAEVIASYAFEGLNEIWLQGKLHYQLNQKLSFNPFISGGLLYQFEPENNIGGSMGIGFELPIEKLSPFLSIRASSNFITMFNEPKDRLWEVIRLDLLIFI